MTGYSLSLPDGLMSNNKRWDDPEGTAPLPTDTDSRNQISRSRYNLSAEKKQGVVDIYEIRYRGGPSNFCNFIPVPNAP